MPGQTATSLEPTVRRMLERLDALDLDSLGRLCVDFSHVAHGRRWSGPEAS
jgi:hypothetical protein